MRSFATVLLLTTTALMGAVPAAAQAPGVELVLNPRIGLYVPVTDLAEVDAETAKLDNSLAIGLGAELKLGALPFGIRANLDYATGSQVNVDDGTVEESVSDATLLALAGDLVFRPLPNMILFQPYLFAGGGIKQYEFDEGIDSESDPTVHLGFGLDFGFGPLSLNAELSDYISSFELVEGESETQHDLFLTLGFAIGLL